MSAEAAASSLSSENGGKTAHEGAKGAFFQVHPGILGNAALIIDKNYSDFGVGPINSRPGLMD